MRRTLLWGCNVERRERIPVSILLSPVCDTNQASGSASHQRKVADLRRVFDTIYWESSLTSGTEEFPASLST